MYYSQVNSGATGGKIIIEGNRELALGMKFY